MGDKAMNQEKNKWLLKRSKSKGYFRLQTLIVLFIVIFCIGTTSFNSMRSVNSTDIDSFNHSTGFDAFPKNYCPISQDVPFLHPIDPPTYDAPYEISLTWDPLINATMIQIFRSNTKNYSTAVQLGGDYDELLPSYTDYRGLYDEKILGNTYYYVIKVYYEVGYNYSNWQNVTLPQLLFDQPLEIKLSDVRFTVKTLANLTNLKVYYKIGEEGDSTHYNMGSSSQKGEDGYYTISRKISISSKGPLFYWYRGDLQSGKDVILGTRSLPLNSTEDIKFITANFLKIVDLSSIAAAVIVLIIVQYKTKKYR